MNDGRDTIVISEREAAAGMGRIGHQRNLGADLSSCARLESVGGPSTGLT